MKSVLAIAALPVLALAKTNLVGCTSSASGASLVWWDPTNGEICSILDCGGGRAPPKTTVPGCAAYEGTATYEPSYLPGWGEATSTPTAAYEESTTGYPVSTSTGYGTTIPASEAKPTTLSPSGYPTSTVTASEVEPTTLTTKPATLPLVTGTGGVPYPTGGNSTITSATVSAPPQQTNGAGVMRVGVAGLVAGVFGLAVL